MTEGDGYAGIRPLTARAFGASGRTRGYRHVTHGPRGPGEPVAAPGKVCPPDDSAMEGSPGRLEDGFSFHRDRKGVTMEGFTSMPSAYPVSYDEGRIEESLG